MSARRTLLRQSSSLGGEEIAPENPDDPIDILPLRSSPSSSFGCEGNGDYDDDDDDDDDNIASLAILSGNRGIGRNTSFFAPRAKPTILSKILVPLKSNLRKFYKRRMNNNKNNSKKKKKKRLPMVKITHTARQDMNGKYGWVHSYSKSRDRYAVTLVEEPSRVYFGLEKVPDVISKLEFSGGKMKRVVSRGGLVKYMEDCVIEEEQDKKEEDINNKQQQQQQHVNGGGSGSNKSKEKSDAPQSIINKPARPQLVKSNNTTTTTSSSSDPSTLYLPPTTLSPLTSMDILNLHIDHFTLNILAMPSLSRYLRSITSFFEIAILPAMSLEHLSSFIVLLLPVTFARFYKAGLSMWMTMTMTDEQQHQQQQNNYQQQQQYCSNSHEGGEEQSILVDGRGNGILAGVWESISQPIPSTTTTTSIPPPHDIVVVPNNAIFHILAAPYLHPAEFATLLVLLLGTNTIARFLLSEYHLVKRKAEAMKKAMRTNEFTSNKGGGSADDNFTAYEMFEYRIDYYFSTSKWAKVALLLSFTFVLIAVGAGLLAVCLEDHSISNAVWIAWTYVADPGTHADAPAGFFTRLISFSITVGGMLIFALMIGIISEYIGDKVDELKKGKSRIIESDHTVILGWNDKSLAIIQQIALANESEGGGTIVVLADVDKDELESKLASALQSIENPLELLGTEVIFRSGNPLMECELRRVSANTARSVIALSLDDLDPDEADSNMVRQVMALKAFDEFGGNDAHVVVEVNDVDNQELFSLVAPDFAEVVVTHDIIGRLMLQCARCPGLACVLEEMMGFEGSEFYFEEWPELVGKTFYDITCRFDEAVPIGIKTADGKVFINPANDQKIEEGDKILVLAEDNDSYEVNDGTYKIHNIGEAPDIAEDEQKVEKIMFCGWRRDMADMIAQLDEYVQEGSELWLFNSVPAQKRSELLKDKGNKEELVTKNLTICNVVGNPIIRRDLNRMNAVDNFGKPTGKEITLDQFDSILILADAVAMENGAAAMSCDSRSLSSLLIIQDIQKKVYAKSKLKDPDAKPPCAPISEILDTRTKSLLKVAHCHGYIMSNQIISSVMAQVSEDKDINIVLREILTADGSETYIRKVTRFVDLEKESNFSFWDIALRARQRREVAVGYKPAELEFLEATHLIINPADKFIPRKWSPDDMIVTFALE